MTATESSVITARLVFGLGGATLAFLMFFLGFWTIAPAMTWDQVDGLCLDGQNPPSTNQAYTSRLFCVGPTESETNHRENLGVLVLLGSLVVFAGSVVYAVRPIRATPDAKVLG